MATYRVIHKFIYRASTRDIEMGKDSHGYPIVVRQHAGLRRIEVGELLDDLSPEELVGLQDRVELVPDDQVAQAKAIAADPTFRPEAGVHEPASGPGDKVHKPPLTAAQVTVMHETETALATADARMAHDQQALDLKKTEMRQHAVAAAHDKAMRRLGAGSAEGTAAAATQGAPHDDTRAQAAPQASEETHARTVPRPQAPHAAPHAPADKK